MHYNIPLSDEKKLKKIFHKGSLTLPESSPYSVSKISMTTPMSAPLPHPNSEILATPMVTNAHGYLFIM